MWLLSITAYGHATQGSHDSNHAVIDLTDQTWGEGNAFSLAGAWDFYWGKFVNPTASLAQESRQKVSVPGAWDDKRNTLKPFPSMGYASYRLQILTPPGITQLYLYVPDMASAYQLWNNGTHIGGNGIVGTDRISEHPAYLPKVLEVTPHNGKLDILIHTSNFHYQWGGLWYEPKITDASGVFSIREQPLIKATIFGTLLISTAIFSMALFLCRRQEKKALFFSLLCITIGIRRLIIDERALYLLDWLDWNTLQSIENICIYLILPLFLSYLASCFPREVNKTIPRLGIMIAVPFCLAALFTEVHFYTELNTPFQALLILLIPYIFYIYSQVLKAKRSGAKMFGFSLLVFALAAINDTLNYNYLINTPNMIHWGALAFVLFQLTLLLRRYLLNFKTIKAMSIELAARNRELVRLDEFKDEFLATTSHELRTPLHGIAGLAQLLRQESSNYSSSQQHKIDLIESTTKRLSCLVNDVLDFSSIKHGKLKLNTSAIHFAPLAENVFHTLKPLLKGKNVKLICNIDEDAGYVMADEHRLQQILFNLIGNAIKFTDSGQISLSAARIGSQVNIVIQDTGAGIPTDKVDLLFQPFEQYLKEGREITSGSGLGLSITRQLVRLHRGELNLSSKEGEGTRIEFTLPVSEENMLSNTPDDLFQVQNEAFYEQEVAPVKTNAPDNATETTSLSAPSGETALIFYADDEEVNRELVRSQLSQAGYRVKTFTNGARLIDELEHQNPELILLDLLMPGMNGLESCHKIRTQFNSYELPIMMLTARYQINDIVAALNAGANDYLIKPYHEKELLARVFSQLSVKRFWHTSKENEKLKTELDQRDNLELELTRTNIKLQQALDISDECVALLNEDLDIVFTNQSTAQLLGDHADDMLGHTVAHYIAPPSFEELRQLTRTDSTSEFNVGIQLIKENRQLYASVKPFDDNNERYFVIVLSDSKTHTKANTQDLLKNLTKELADNRQRIDQIESALSQVSQSENWPNGTEAESTTKESSFLNPKEHAKEIVVKALRTSLITWERYTHQNKADLAEQSHCWRVYIDGTTAKTRTLDKYLSTKTLPEKPRWRAVIKTANYVIDHCALSDDDLEELSSLIQSVDDAYS